MPDGVPNIQQTVTGNNNIFSATGDVFVVQNPLAPTEARTRRDLGTLRNKVKTFWISGFLEKSLYQMVLLDLGKEARPDAIDHPWESVLELPDQAGHLLARETKIINIFDQANRALLILGEPGSGKTIALLELTRDLIDRSEVDTEFSQPVPVIFNLSSWAERRQPLIDWMAAELASKYQIPKQLGYEWLEQNRLLPLLDGLDEVKAGNRSACVLAINDFERRFGLAGLVVCCRLREYTTLPVRLKFNAAINLQPLTSEQIKDYLSAVGPKLSGLQAALADDNELSSLAQSPLILSIMTLAYQDVPAEQLMSKASDTLEERRHHLFDTYIDRMFKRHGSGTQPYSPEKTKEWLSWLARMMLQHKHNIFLIEELQPIWLTDRNTRRSYVIVSRAVIAMGYMISSLLQGLVIGIGLGLIDLWRFEKPGPALVTSKAPQETLSKANVKICTKCGFENDKKARKCANCLIDLQWAKVNLSKFQGTAEDTRRIGMESRKQRGFPVPEDYMPTLAEPIKEDSSDNLSNTTGSHQLSFVLYLLWILLVSILSFGVNNNNHSNSGGLINTIIVGLSLGGILWSRANQTNLSNEIKPAESIQWSWRPAIRAGCGTWFIMLVFVIIYLVTDSFSGMDKINGGSPDLMLRCLTASIVTFPIILSSALIGGVKARKVETKTYPNQGIRLTIRNTLIITLGFGTIVFLAQLVLHQILSSYPIDLFFIVLFFALWGGGLAVIQHYTLRFLLWRKEIMPWDYARFLDYATDRIFLRKVGGGYIFIHRLMMEHFAQLGKTQEKT